MSDLNVSGSVVKSTVGLREVLFEELNALRGGITTPARANAVARTVAQILSTVKTEIEYVRFLKDVGNKQSRVEPLMLD